MPVYSTGTRLFVEVPTAWSALRVVRAADVDFEEVARVLTTAELTTEVRVRGRTVAVVGTDARPGFVSRELGIDPAEFRVGGALTALGDGVRATVERVVSMLP
ncbi:MULTISPECIES: peptide ABC transporter ATP-binding protein [Haloferax]